MIPNDQSAMTVAQPVSITRAQFVAGDLPEGPWRCRLVRRTSSPTGATITWTAIGEGRAQIRTVQRRHRLGRGSVPKHGGAWVGMYPAARNYVLRMCADWIDDPLLDLDLPPLGTLPDMIARATWRTESVDAVLTRVIDHQLVAIAAEADVQIYYGAGAVWGIVRRDDDRYDVAPLTRARTRLRA